MCRVSYFACAVVLAAPFAERGVGGQAAPSQRPVPTFSSAVELITVDAVVVDEAGHPVAGLTQEDFVVSEDGHAQQIASFEAFVLEAPAAVAAAVTPVSSNEATGSSGRAFAILLDDVRVAPERSELARGAVASLLERSAREGDEVTVATTSGDVSWSARIPDGREDLLAVLPRIRGRDANPRAPEFMTEYEAFRIANYEDSPASSSGLQGGGSPNASGVSRTQAGDPPIPGGLGAIKERVKRRWAERRLCDANCEQLVRGRAADIDAQRQERTRLTLRSVRRQLDALALVRGRKSLLLLSDGFVEDYGSDLREVAAASREANTAIYFLDLRGLVGITGFGGAEDPGNPPDLHEQGTMRFEEQSLAAAGAEALADETGGFSVRNTNDLAGGVQRIADESRVFYLLGFYPPEGKSAREWRKLKVEVKKPGLKVRARRGYTLKTAPATLLDPRPKKNGKPYTTFDPKVAQALDSPHAAADIPLRAMAYVLEPRPKDATHVVVAVEFDASRLAFQPKEKARVAHLEVSVVATSRDTGRGFRYDDATDVAVAGGEGAPGWRALAREFELPAGVTQARVVVRDTSSGALGSVSHRFEVPPPGQLRLSTPILTELAEPAKDGKGRPRLALAVHRNFPAEGGLYVQFEVFGARAAGPGGPKVSAGLEMWSASGRLARKLDPTPIAADPDGRVVRQAGIALDGLEEGPYDLVLNVRDELSGSGLKRRESFTLARATTPLPPARP